MQRSLLVASLIISLLGACSSGGGSKTIRNDGGGDTRLTDAGSLLPDSSVSGRDASPRAPDGQVADVSSAMDTGAADPEAGSGEVGQVGLLELSLTAPAASLHVGGTLPISAYGLFEDGSRRELTGKVAWSLVVPGTATISATGILTGVAPGKAMVQALFEGQAGRLEVTITALPVVLTALQLVATPTSIELGTTAKVAAMATYSDGSKRDVSAGVAWTSSAPTVATVSAAGVVTGVGEGSATIKAVSEGVEGTVVITVTKPTATLTSIAVTASAATLTVGATMPLVATGTYSDGSKKDISSVATWTSGSPALATVTAAGVAKGVAAGTVTFKAAYQGKEGTVAVTIAAQAATYTALAITTASASVPAGNQVQLTATATKSDGSKQDVTQTVAWSSGTPAVATVNAQGLASTLKAGSVTFTAKLEALTGTVNVTVTNAVLVGIAVTPALPVIAMGTTQAFVATGTYSDASKQVITDQVGWTSSAPAVATISGAGTTRGVATARAKGTTTITASLGGRSGTTVLTVTDAVLKTITLTPTRPNLARGTVVQLRAMGTYSDNDTKDLTADCTWSTSAGNIATVSNATGSDGLVTGVAAGTADITATLGAVSGSVNVRVTSATLSSIEITPANPTIAAGTTRQFVATGVFSDQTRQDISTLVNWTSSSPAVATIDNSAGSVGLAKGLTEGTTTIRAAFANRTGNTLLTVSPATLDSLTLSATYQTIAKGTTSQFKATGHFSDGSEQDLTTQATWTSSDTAVATIANEGADGLATGLAAGTTNIRASYGGRGAQLSLTVTAATLSSLAITPAAPSLANGTTKALTATGTFSDGSRQDLTTQVNWSAVDTTIATVSNAAGKAGVVQGEGEGKTIIVVALGDKGTSTEVTVTRAERAKIAIDQTAPSLAVGTVGALTATLTYTNGDTEDATALVTWTSATTATATVSNEAAHQGQVTTKAVGTSVLTITLGTLSAKATLTVTTATLQSLAIVPATDAEVAVGETLAFKAIGTFTDESTQDLTIQASWSSADAEFATVSSASPNDGIATGVAAGEVEISATVLGKTAKVSLTVTD